MNQLDAMAARAVDSVHVAVATRAPVANVPRLIGLGRRAMAMRVAFGVAAVVGVIGIAGLFQLTDPSQPADIPATTVAPTPTTIAPEVVDTPTPFIPIPEGPVGPVSTEPPTPVVTEPPEPTEPTEPVEPPDTTPPPLTITSPADGAHIEKTAVTFRGTTEPGAKVAAGQWQATVDSSGGWSLILIVKPGRNVAKFTATDAAGNQTVKSITVIHEEVEPPKETAELTANFKYGSCEENPPFDVYWGTAEPSAKINVTSEFGSGFTTVDGEGNWELKVYFPEAPYAETFLVTIKDGLGGVKKFKFTSFSGGA